MYHGTFTRVARRLYMFPMSLSNARHASLIILLLPTSSARNYSLTYVMKAWRTYERSMTLKFMTHAYVEWLIHMCDMIHSYVWYDPFMCTIAPGYTCYCHQVPQEMKCKDATHVEKLVWPVVIQLPIRPPAENTNTVTHAHTHTRADTHNHNATHDTPYINTHIHTHAH